MFVNSKFVFKNDSDSTVNQKKEILNESMFDKFKQEVKDSSEKLANNAFNNFKHMYKNIPSDHSNIVKLRVVKASTDEYKDKLYDSKVNISKLIYIFLTENGWPDKNFAIIFESHKIYSLSVILNSSTT